MTKRDMQRMRNELPLHPDQLEAVFDTLDADKNGYLTLEEFTDGFGHFLGIEIATADEEEEKDPIREEMMNGTTSPDAFLEADEEEEFNNLLCELGLMGLVEDDEAVR